MRLSFPILAVISVIFTAFASQAPADMQSAERDDLAKSLEATYLKWRTAVLEKDIETWHGVTASYTKMNIRNTIVSQRLNFPDAFFKTPLSPPAIENLTFLGANAAGQTAQAVYFGKVDFELTDEDVEVPETLLVLRFIKEGADWKFDTTRMMGLAGMDDLEKQIRSGDYSFLNDEAFTPPGNVPPVPQPCKRPDKIAHLQLLSIGYDTEVTINGGSRHFVSNNKANQLIIGGLSGGSNEIKFRTRPSPRMSGDEEVPREFGIRIVTVDDQGIKDPVEVFKYEPEEGKPAPASFKAYVRGRQ